MVEAREIYGEASRLAAELGGHYMDQFMYAERVTDWRGNNSIAESLFRQMENEVHPIPNWVVVSAGTGGTSATIGRYIRYRPELFERTQLCVVDPENSVFFDHFESGDVNLQINSASRIEGIGRPRVEPSFLRTVVDRMLRIPDAASIATIWWLEGILGRRCGGSTGTNVYGAIHLMEEMRASNTKGSVVTMICDSGERYSNTYFDTDWLAQNGIDIVPYLRSLETRH